MSVEYFLNFHEGDQGRLLLPRKCGVSIACYDSAEVHQLIVSSIEESLYALALDARKSACELQSLLDGVIPLEMSDRPETMDLARTVAVSAVTSSGSTSS